MEKGLNYLSNEKQYVMEMNQKTGNRFSKLKLINGCHIAYNTVSDYLNVSRLKPSLHGIETKPNVT